MQEFNYIGNFSNNFGSNETSIYAKIGINDSNKSDIEDKSTGPSEKDLGDDNYLFYSDSKQIKGDSYSILDAQNEGRFFNLSPNMKSEDYSFQLEDLGIIESEENDSYKEQPDNKEIRRKHAENMQTFLNKKKVRDQNLISLYDNQNKGRKKKEAKNKENPGKHVRTTPDNLCKKIKKYYQESGISFFNLIFEKVFKNSKLEKKEYTIQKLTMSVNANVEISSNRKWFLENAKLYKYFSEKITDNRIKGTDDYQNKINFERIFENLNNPLIQFCKEITVVDYFNEIFLADKPSNSKFLLHLFGKEQINIYKDIFDNVQTLNKCIDQEKKKGKLLDDEYCEVLSTYAKSCFIQRFCNGENKRNKKFKK